MKNKNTAPVKMLILQGPPAVGKSFYAREFIKDKSDSWVIVNRDSIRRMFGNYWVPKRENLVTDVECEAIYAAFEYGYNVVVDDTNLNPITIAHLQAIADISGAEVEYKKFYEPLDVLLERDKNRECPVGEDVIRNFYKKYYENV